MALIQKDENDNLVTLAAKSNPIAFYTTDQAAEDAYDNGEIPEGTIVFTEEDAEDNSYSTTPMNTGRKWLDGKDVYEVVYNTTAPHVVTNGTAVIKYLDLPANFGRLLSLTGSVENGTASGYWYPFPYYSLSSGTIKLQITNSSDTGNVSKLQFASSAVDWNDAQAYIIMTYVEE